MIRDKFGSPTETTWNQMMKDQYEKYEKRLKELNELLERSKPKYNK